MVKHPKEFWKSIAEKKEWRDYILPRVNESDFDAEGFAEAQRLFYFFDKRSTVIDYGCGVARVLKYVAERAGRVIGLDVCDEFLDRARSIVAGNNIEFYPSDGFNEIGIADFAYCIMVMQNNTLEGQQKIIRHIWQLLMDNGMAIISFPRYESTYYREDEAFHKFHRQEVASLADGLFDYRIIEANLPGYAKRVEGLNEYFMIATKKGNA